MPSTVAIVDDEEHLREAVAEYLADRGLRVFAAGDAAAMRALAERERIDVAVLDIAMPGENGLALARWLRARGERPGIIFATSAGAPKDRVAGLELGADDYVVKPYDLRELLARVRGVLRRLPEAAPVTAAAPAARADIAIGAFRFDPASHRLLDAGGEEVELTAAEAALLLVFATRPNRILSRGQLLDLTGDGGDASGRAIDVRIARLRGKLRAGSGEPEPIRTIRGEGYMFVPGGAA